MWALVLPEKKVCKQLEALISQSLNLDFCNLYSLYTGVNAIEETQT
jgi:hypothetical protein